jgi:parallel beta-helix repeat protein
VVVQDTRLDSDLQCGEGAALTIASAGVTLDLGGHALVGTFAEGSVGVAAAGVSDLVVRDGAVRQFDTDVLLQDVSSSLVRGLAGAHIRVFGNANTVRSSIDSGGIAVRGDQNVLYANEVTSSPSLDDATWLSAAGAENLISHNVVSNVSPSSADTSAFGLLLRLHGGYVRHNVVTGAAAWQGGSDVSAVGIHLSGDGAIVRRNTASGLSDGFLVAGVFRLLDNFAYENLDDGIDVDVSGNRLTRNTANDNGDLGIEAVPATIDGRGNRARGNGNPAQCIGVVCR